MTKSTNQKDKGAPIIWTEKERELYEQGRLEGLNSLHNKSRKICYEEGQKAQRQADLQEEIEWLESIQEDLLLGKRRKGQHKYNKISVKERIATLKGRS